jgi:hypothetical protein
MNDTNAMTEIDEATFMAHRDRFGAAQFAQSADALVSQITEMMASEPVCEIVTPLNREFKQRALALLHSTRWVATVETNSLEIDGVEIHYCLIIIRKPGK